MSWIEVRATLPATIDASPFIEIFRGHGIESTQEEGDQLFGCLADVEETPKRVDALREALVAAGAAGVSDRPFPEQNWDEMWRQFFHPIRIGRRMVVRPTWEPFAAEPDDVVIVLDPGEAFGTGDHPTTRLCLELLEEACDRQIHAFRVADVGCGSGILAIAARMLGAADVDAVDLDPTSVGVARANSSLNGVTIRFELGDGIAALPPSSEGAGYDIVVSNIISAVLMRMASQVARVLRPAGAWIVSGILRENWPLVASAARAEGFELAEFREQGEWVAAAFRA